MVTNKGQGAMEYISVYGWAIIAIMVVGVVLWQIGILEPMTNPTGGVVGFGRVKPVDWACKTASNTVDVEWVNAAGQHIKVTATDGGCVYDGATYTSGQTFNMSRTESAVCSYVGLSGCADVGPGDRFESQVTLTWEPRGGGIVHTEGGSVWKPAE